MVIKVKGKAILSALENAVSQYPALEGRFPQVSNIEFEFDPSLPPNARVKYVNLGGAPLDHEKSYVLVTRGYMARGKDGFDSLLVQSEGGEAEEIVSEENGILISMMLRQYFMSLKIVGQWKMWGNSMDRHWKEVQKSMSSSQLAPDSQSKTPGLGEVAGNAFTTQEAKTVKGTEEVSDLKKEEEIEEPIDESDEEVSADEEEAVKAVNVKREREMKLARKVTKKWWRLAGLPGQPKCCDEVFEFRADWTRVCVLSSVLWVKCD